MFLTGQSKILILCLGNRALDYGYKNIVDIEIKSIRCLPGSYWVKTEEATEVNVTLEEQFSDGSDTAYNRVASSGDITPGEWVQVTGTLEVGANTAKACRRRAYQRTCSHR